MEVFQKLCVWLDPSARPGPESMAVDQWLLATVTEPVLRIYGWAGDWASLGYFGKIAEARMAFPEVQWVRRWTGGGLVDHRCDWAYTLVTPQHQPLAKLRGGESYRWIHLALAAVLTEEGQMAVLSAGGDETGAALCFENPVSYDIVGADGQKLAGAGQRRTRHGLLHQGSVNAPCISERSRSRGIEFAKTMAAEIVIVTIEVNHWVCAKLSEERYRKQSWIEMR